MHLYKCLDRGRCGKICGVLTFRESPNDFEEYFQMSVYSSPRVCVAELRGGQAVAPLIEWTYHNVLSNQNTPVWKKAQSLSPIVITTGFLTILHEEYLFVSNTKLTKRSPK